MLKALHLCELCGDGGTPAVVDMPSDGQIPVAEGWMSLYVTTNQRELPPKYDEVVANVPAVATAFLAAELRPFQTEIHLCPEHRKTATVADLDAIYMQRFRERDEVDPEEEPEPEPVVPLRKKR